MDNRKWIVERARAVSIDTYTGFKKSDLGAGLCTSIMIGFLMRPGDREGRKWGHCTLKWVALCGL
jgi:hypothetical protein